MFAFHLIHVGGYIRGTIQETRYRATNSAPAYFAVTGAITLIKFEEMQAEMDSVFDAVQRIKGRIHYALAVAQRAWVRWVFKPSKQDKPSIERKAA